MTAASTSRPDPPLWSVLIATLASRRDLLAGLLEVLLPQCEADGRVEVLACHDNGEHHLTVKRRALLGAAGGVYASFIDDDDMVDEEFVRLVTAAMSGLPDYIRFDHFYYVDGGYNMRVRTGLHAATRHPVCGELIRPVTHVNPVRRDLTAGVSFGGVAPGEDRAYVLQIQPRLSTEAAAAERPLYHYRHRTYDSVQRALAPHTGLPRLEVDSPCFRWIEVP